MKWVAAGAGGILCLAGWGGDAAQVRSTRCRLAIGHAREISAATGQNPLSIRLTNRGAKACLLKGYPGVVLLDARGRRIPFRISHDGDQMVTSRRPTAVRVRPGRSAFVLLNKFRCDRGDLTVARKLRLAPPGPSASPRLRLALRRYPILGYCGRNDPGSIVTVSPIEPTLYAALAHS